LEQFLSCDSRIKAGFYISGEKQGNALETRATSGMKTKAIDVISRAKKSGGLYNSKLE
jgi:hypothetical protein